MRNFARWLIKMEEFILFPSTITNPHKKKWKKVNGDWLCLFWSWLRFFYFFYLKKTPIQKKRRKPNRFSSLFFGINLHGCWQYRCLGLEFSCWDCPKTFSFSITRRIRAAWKMNTSIREKISINNLESIDVSPVLHNYCFQYSIFKITTLRYSELSLWTITPLNRGGSQFRTHRTWNVSFIFKSMPCGLF